MGVRSIVAAVTVAVASATVVVTPSSAAAGGTAPTGLEVGGAFDTGSPTLSWTPVRKAASYEVRVDDDPAFGSPEMAVGTVSTHAVPTTLLKPGEQHWQVRSIGADRAASAWTDGEAFEVGPVGAPTDLSPVDGTDVQQPAPARLSWSPVRGATSYVVQVDREEDFVGASQYSTSVTSLVVPDSLAAADDGTDYFWHVKAVKGSGIESAYSAVSMFEVLPLERPTIVGPGSSSSEDVTDVELDWDPVPGAQHYQLQVSTDDDFSTSTLVDDQTKVLGTRYSPKVTYDNNQYYWRVRAVDTSGNPTRWSDVGQFRRAWPDSAPDLVWPGDADDVSTSLFLEWEPVPLATQYELVMGTDANFSPGTFSSCLVVGTTYTPGMFRLNESTGQRQPITQPESCWPNPGTRTYWRVRALDRPFTKSGSDVPGVAGLYSETRSFTYRPDALSVGDVSPADGATVAVPVLSWAPTRWAETYRITVRNATGSAVVSNVTTRATSYTPVTSAAMTPAAGPYTWSLSAVGADGRTASLVQQRSFSLSGSVPTSGATPLTPLTAVAGDAATHRAPSMSWEPMPGAAYYKVQAGPAGGASYDSSTVSGDLLDTKVFWPALTDTWTWFTKPGEYDWRVTAYSSTNAVLGTGPVGTLTVADLDEVTGVEIALDASTIDAGQGSEGCGLGSGGDCDVEAPSTPVVSWDPVPGAGLYVVYVSEDDKFTNLVEPITAFPATTSTYWAPTTAQLRSALAESEAGASYFVHVRPCANPSACGPRPVSRTPSLATLRFRKTSPPVALVRPAAGDVVADGEVTFDWDDYRDTNAATTWDDTGEASTQSAQWYRLQVDDDASFSSPLEEVRVDQSTYTSAARLYPEGTLHWRVQAIDAEDNDLAWSPRRTFVKQTRSPALEAPADGATRSTTTEFSWAPQPFAASYTIELYRNGDTNFSASNRVFTKTVRQTAYAWDQVIAPSSSPYVWRVRVNDPSGNPGPWTAARTFTVSGEAPTAESPTGGGFVEGDDVLLQWTTVGGAASYDVELRPVGGGAAQTTTTKAAAWAPTRALADGEWQWRVTADDQAGNALGSSGWATFRVDENGPTVVRRTPATPRPTSAFTVTFSEPAKGVSSTSMQIHLAGRKGNLPARVSTAKGGLTATLKPSRRLKPGSYTITLSNRVTDARGNRLAPYEWPAYVQ